MLSLLSIYVCVCVYIYMCIHIYIHTHIYISVHISSVQSLGRFRLFATPWTIACQASLSITNSQSLLKLIPIELGMPSNHFILCRPLLLPTSVFPSIRVFSNESVLHIRWPKYWSFISISLSNEYSGMISFRMDWLDLLAVQGTLKSLLQCIYKIASVLSNSLQPCGLHPARLLCPWDSPGNNTAVGCRFLLGLTLVSGISALPSGCFTTSAP